jgi:hypothetical protein
MADTKGDLLIVIGILRDEEIIKNETANKLFTGIIKQDKEVQTQLTEVFSKGIINILDKAFEYKRNGLSAAGQDALAEYHTGSYESGYWHYEVSIKRIRK